MRRGLKVHSAIEDGEPGLEIRAVGRVYGVVRVWQLEAEKICRCHQRVLNR